MKGLNGKEEVTSDLEIIDDNEEDDDIEEMDETQRSVKLMLRSGVIPDSTMIHAARKRRQMAREMGVPGDFLPLDNTGENGKNRKSRLIR